LTTIRDVAARAGVSISTVSRALNGDPRVRPDNAREVLRAAKELNYVPNELGRNLRQQTQMVWTLILADIENPFQTTLTRGIEDVARAQGYSVLLCNSDEDPERERRYLEVAEQSRVAGVLIVPTSANAAVGRLVERHVPVVALDRPLAPSARADVVLVNSRAACAEAVEHLLAKGRKAIGLITGPRTTFTAAERVAGYEQALRAGGHPIDPELIRYADFKVDGGRDAATQLLATHPLDGLVVANGLMTIGALQALRDQGMRLSTSIDLVAFDDAPWLTLLGDSITVISQPAYDLGHAAGMLLLDRLRHGQRAAQTVTLAASLQLPAPAPDGRAATPAPAPDRRSRPAPDRRSRPAAPARGRR
jgi:LacI family transcriptional regulator